VHFEETIFQYEFVFGGVGLFCYYLFGERS